MATKKIYDISMPIFGRMQVYRGNPSPKIRQIFRIPTDSANSSLISLGSHCGTHVDMASHIFNDGKNSSNFALQSAIGPCIVWDFTKVAREISIRDVKKAKIGRGGILLLKTRNSNYLGKAFKTDFVYLSMEASLYLIKLGIKAIGTDALSIDQYHSGSHSNHHAFIKGKITIIEGLRLRDVPAGKYKLVCLPLKIEGIDGLPARAVLMK